VDTLTFDDLHRALSRCMTAHPPQGIELSLHADANRLAGLWGLMSYQRTQSVPLGEVDPRVLDAYRRWTAEGPPDS
jgi:hypothetical protein